MKLIAFTGKMGAGKSTAIECLKQLSDKDWALVKFASPLYSIQEHIYHSISPVYERPDNFIKDRKLLQWLGTEWGRSIDPDLWIKLWIENVKCWNEDLNVDLIFCDDCRFDNEAEAIKKLGGIIIRIISHKNDIRIDTAQGISNHSSENGLSESYVDATLENNGTIDELKEKLIELNKRLSLF